MPKSPTKRRPATVAALTGSAQELFLERGFHATSISDIVQRSGLTRGAFYSNYPDKEHLFLALYDAHTDRLLGELRDATARLDGCTDPLERLLEHLAGSSSRERQWFVVSMEFTLHAARHPEVADDLAVREERLVEGLAEVLLDLLARDGRRPALPVADLARLVMAVSEGLNAHAVTHPQADAATGGLARRVLPPVLRALSDPTP
ncbi:TetR/AcrR family transcriptional regulator [Kitasatospora paranensis]|uniref:TetR/AcrR family transcriptional regulator n=1 Tax=Kitasatospora paranensis TaxID=258053 RepID=A0ABW2G4B1_9ACTN